MNVYNMYMVEDLLEKLDILTDIAESIYGEGWVADEKFWGSPTETEMAEVIQSLDNLGHQFETSTEILEAAVQVVNRLG